METKNFNWMKTKKAAAFTLIELLVVIAIIAILASLIVGLAGRAADAKKKARVRTELAQLETAIDSYKEKKGFYPPSNGNTNNAVTNQLFYELSGTVFDGTDEFRPLTGNDPIKANAINSFFNTQGFANSSADKSEVKSFFPAMKSSQFQEIVSTPNEVELMVVPVEGPDDIVAQSGRKINPWRYNSLSPTHNPDSYDLWAEIVVGGKTNIIGNWKE